MINLKKICVFDFETDSPDPLTCQPVELAAIMIDPRKLSFIEGSEFSSMMRPVDIGDEDYYEVHKDTIDWHARTLSKEPMEVLESWKEAPLQKNVWGDFKRYLNMYHITDKRKSIFTAPLAAGANILNFDLPIIQRLSEKYKDVGKRGETKLFYGRDRIDTLLISFLMWENREEPTSYSMDATREFLGMSSEGAHTAIQDVKDTGQLLIRFMRLIRRQTGHVNFKDACKNNPMLQEATYMTTPQFLVLAMIFGCIMVIIDNISGFYPVYIEMFTLTQRVLHDICLLTVGYILGMLRGTK